MATSATEITSNLPILRGLLKEWIGRQAPPSDFTSPLGQTNLKASKNRQENVVVAFRTRPSLDGEAESKFVVRDTVSDDVEGQAAPVVEEERETCLGITLKSAEPGIFVSHWNGHALVHKEYRANLVFGPDISNEEVYQRTVVANNILSLTLSGGVGCIAAYGRTSSGKTYTMEGIESRIARDLFDAAGAVVVQLASASGSDPGLQIGTDTFEFSVTFLQLLGKSATDLVAENAGEIAMRTKSVGNVVPNLTTTVVSSSEELQNLITSALSHRRVVATDRNAQSSRNHAVLNIRINNRSLPYAEDEQLILVDLTGSERYEDSKKHDKRRTKESRENDESLMNLKECVRAEAKMAAEDGFAHIPWQSSKLTMLLKPLFDIESRQPSCAIIIAHVSPHIQDSVHSSTTLSYAAPFLTAPPKPRGPAPYDPKDPRTWDIQHTQAFLRAEFGKPVRVRRKAGWAVQNNHAALRGKSVEPKLYQEPTDDELEWSIDIEKLCPDGYTANNLGALYTTDFVSWYLAAKIDAPGSDSVAHMCAEVVGRLFYLIITAKTKSRNNIMKSRKKLDIASAYGDAPANAFEEDPEIQADNPLFQERYETHGQELKAELDAIHGNGAKNVQALYPAVRRRLEELKAAKAKKALEEVGKEEI